MTFSPDKFRTHIAAHGDLAKPSKFEVKVFRGNTVDVTEASRGLSLQCEAAELPGFNINTIESKVYGPSWHIASIPTYSDVTLTFLCATNMWEKSYFENWMQKIIPTGYINNTTLTDVSPHAQYRDDYFSTIFIDQYAEYNSSKPSYRCALIGAFPISMASLSLNWGDSDGVHRLQVTFKYSKWMRIEKVSGAKSIKPTSNTNSQPAQDGIKNN
jgi:hypothetical protein